MTRRRAVFSHHKCGTSWVGNVIRTVCHSVGVPVINFHSAAKFGDDIQKAFDAAADGIVIWTNADYRLIRDVEMRAVHVIRDPRDVIVSGYFSHRNSHPTNSWPSLVAHRRNLQAAQEEQGIGLELTWPETQANLRRIGEWNYDDSRILNVKFEDLVENERLFFRMFQFLDLMVDGLTDEAGWRAVEKYRFENVTGGRSRGKEDVSSHFRNGRPGNWKRYLTDQLGRQFDETYGGLIDKLGYPKGVNSSDKC